MRALFETGVYGVVGCEGWRHRRLESGHILTHLICSCGISVGRILVHKHSTRISFVINRQTMLRETQDERTIRFTCNAVSHVTWAVGIQGSLSLTWWKRRQISVRSSSRMRQAVGACGVQSRTSRAPITSQSLVLPEQTHPTFAFTCLPRPPASALPSPYIVVSPHTSPSATTKLSPLSGQAAASAANATHLLTPAAIPGGVGPGPPPATAPSCSPAQPTAGASPSTGSGASPGSGSGTGGRCSSSGSPAAALRSNCRQQRDHSTN